MYYPNAMSVYIYRLSWERIQFYDLFLFVCLQKSRLEKIGSFLLKLMLFEMVIELEVKKMKDRFEKLYKCEKEIIKLALENIADNYEDTTSEDMEIRLLISELDKSIKEGEEIGK